MAKEDDGGKWNMFVTTIQASSNRSYGAIGTAWQPTIVFLPGESHWQSILAGYSSYGRKESDKTEVT